VRQVSCELSYIRILYYCLLLHQNPDWFYLSGTSSPDSPGKRAVKRVCVSLFALYTTVNVREGNRRSGVALAIRHGLQWFIQSYRLNAFGVMMSTPPRLPTRVWHTAFLHHHKLFVATHARKWCYILLINSKH